MADSDHRISILMPVKNAGDFLEECLDSILAQTEKNWELIAVNDHSTDQTEQILKKYARSDPRIRLFHNAGSGIIDALRLAYDQSDYPLITRMDADDRMAAEKLNKLKKALLEKGKGTVATGMVQYFSSEKMGKGYLRYAEWLNTLTINQDHFSAIYRECVIPSPCWLAWRQDLQQCNAFRESQYPEDYDLCFRFYEAGFKVHGIPEILHFWRDYPTRSSRVLEQYKDQYFIGLKLQYFLKLDFDPRGVLFIWGAGKKAKKTARILLKKGVSFQWITNNPAKIGKKIYGIRLANYKSLLHKSFTYNLKKTPADSKLQKEERATQVQIIISVASPNDQAEIRSFIEAINLEEGVEYWFFV